MDYRVHGVTKSQTRLSNFHFSADINHMGLYFVYFFH